MSPAKALNIAMLVVSSSLLAACGPATYVAYDDPPARARAQEPLAQAPAVVVVVTEAPGEAPSDGWVPEETHGESPFASVRVWSGDYDCPQGNTDFTLRILAVRGQRITALFDFHHVESGEAGRYLVAGDYDPETRRVRFTPGDWLVHPPNYVSTSMSGEVSHDGSLFAGRIDHPLCGAFRLRPAR